MRWPLAVSAAIVAVSGRVDSLVNSNGGPVPAGVRLELSSAYVVTSPLSRTLDAISLFSLPQTFWFFGLVLALSIVPRMARLRREHASMRRLLRIVFVPVVICALVEAMVILLPRPMARLVDADRDVVRVDFHSHTNASHDAYKRFTAEKNRSWHASGGFDVVYVTDHVKWGGALAAKSRNPVKAGEGTSLLTGVEGHYHKVSTVLLGFDAADSAMLTRWGELKRSFPDPRTEPVAIAALPANLDSVERAVEDTLPRFAGLELVDAAPRGLGELDRQEAEIRRIASRHGLILVASSNNHGWGQTAAAWNLVRIPGWRTLTPDSVGALIENVFRARDSAALTVVQRNRVRLSGAAAMFTLPLTAFEVAGSLSRSEGIAWLAWLWLAFVAIVWLHERKRIGALRDDETSEAPPG